MAMPTGTIIVYRVLRDASKTSKLNMNKFCRQFYGYLDRSNRGKYEYQRKGFIEQYRHIKPLRGVIVVRREDSETIIGFLKNCDAELFVREVILLDEDIERLGMK